MSRRQRYKEFDGDNYPRAQENRLYRLSKEDQNNPIQKQFLEENPILAEKVKNIDPKSFAYYDVIDHLAIQRCTTNNPAYKTNQMIKHAFEDKYMSEAKLKSHTDKMYDMPDDEAY